MKKSVCLGLLCTVLFASALFTGCGGDAEVSANTLEKVKTAGVLRVGVKADVPKFGLLNPETNTYEGFEIDLARILAEKILGDSTKLELTTVNSKTRGPLLDKGDVDMVIATFTITEERKKSYDFSDAYLTDSIGFLVKKDSGIESIKDMDGKTLGVGQSSTTKTDLEGIAKEKGVTLEFSEFATYPEIKSALDAGRVQVLAVDKSMLHGYLDDTTVILEEGFVPQAYGVVIKKGNDELTTLVNETLAEMKDNGEFDALLEKWELK